MMRPIQGGVGVFALLGVFVLGACSETQLLVHTAKRMSKASAPVGITTYKVGKPYEVEGVWYYPAVNYNYAETGIGSWYGPKFHGLPTANGEIYDMNDLTAAHRTLPLPSLARVTNLQNGRSIVLKVNDRGPFVNNRIIDVSRRGAQLLGYLRDGTARVRVEILARESQAIAAQLTGGTAATGRTPILVDKLPKPRVVAETIPLPPGGNAAPGSGGLVKAKLPAPVDGVAVARPAARIETITLGKVQAVPVLKTEMYVQAGAFSDFDNANRVSARLSPIGPVKVSSVLINGRDIYRVRVGPLANVTDADQFLESVIRAGFADARIVVDCFSNGAALKSPKSRFSTRLSEC